MRSEPGVAEAAANNAAWCDAVARSHGITGSFAADAWTASMRTPPLYSDAVTLRPDVDAPSLLTRIDTGPGASVKDSFARLDLAPFGFSVLFDATWIARSPGTGSLTGDTLRLVAVDASSFAVWETAWRGDDGPADVLRASLLDEPSASILAATGADDTIVAGAIAYATSDSIGVSNVFAPPELVDEVWRGLVAWRELHVPGATLLGYESGADLAAARRAGFDPIGPLRVWVRTS